MKTPIRKMTNRPRRFVITYFTFKAMVILVFTYFMFIDPAVAVIILAFILLQIILFT